MSKTKTNEKKHMAIGWNLIDWIMKQRNGFFREREMKIENKKKGGRQRET